MKSENNGKIAIAIVAMFVVALSVVGFTYAYFTAQIKGNTGTKSVEVSAGKLSVTYSNGTKLSASNIVPGWISDGKHYYDPIYSKVETTINSGTATEAKISMISAVSTDDKISCNVSGVAKTEQKISACDNSITPSADYGLVSPAEFTVSEDNYNTGDVMYAIRLKNISNSIADKEHVYVVLYDGSGNYKWSGQLGTSGTQIIGEVQTLTHENNNSASASYKVGVVYQNVENGDQSAPEGVVSAILFDIEVVGIQSKVEKIENVDTTVYYDADGNKVSFVDSTSEPSLSFTTTTTTTTTTANKPN